MQNVLQNGIPVPNVPGCDNPATPGCPYNYTTPNLHADHYRSINLRVDHNISANEKLFGTFFEGHRLEIIAQPGAASAADAGFYPLENTWRYNYGASINLTSILSPTLVSTLNIGWLRHNGLGFSTESGVSATSLGFDSGLSSLFGADNYPTVGFTTNTAQAVGVSGPAVRYNRTGNNYINFGAGHYSTTYNNNWSVQETLNKVTGAHSLKWGFMTGITLQDSASASQFPTINFSDVFTRQTALEPHASSTDGSAIATALLGYPTDVSYTNPFLPSYATKYFALFLQDDWHVSSKLSVNLGLRWDAQTPPHERYNSAVIGFDPSAPSIGAAMNPLAGFCYGPSSPNDALLCPSNGTGGSYVGGLVYATPGNRSPFRNHFNNWGPRFGMAYQITKNIVFRGGWGRFFDYASAGTFPPSTGYTSTTSISPTANVFATPTLCADVTGCTPDYAGQGLSAHGYAYLFPSGLNPVSGSSAGAATGVGTSIQFIDPNFRPLSVDHFSAGLQFLLPFQAVANIAYNGSRGHNLPLALGGGGFFGPPPGVNRNSISESQYLQLGNAGLLGQQVLNPFQGLMPGTSFDLPSTISVQQMLQPYPQFSTITETNIGGGKSWYNSLQVSLNKRLSHGLTFLTNFTWARNLDATHLFNPNFDNISQPYVAPSGSEQPYLWNIAMSYNIPIFGSSSPRLLSSLLGGWTIAGNATFQSGGLVGTPSGILWTGLDPTKKISGVWTGQTMSHWFNNCIATADGTAIFNTSVCPTTNPADAPWQLTGSNYYLNNVPSNFEHLRRQQPPISNLSLYKSFAIRENLKFGLRLDVYNLTNTPWLGGGQNGASIGTNAFAPNFGVESPNEGNDPRTLQLSGNITF